ncbi:sugar phosphate isomerase/epimerase family protein [Amycolatopsis sp.]|uniref:sugar phosphate isomerase/epimerase family protein n=1 Tax=Amycolatopsis sp. TaxID=37632 RepID=UPI002B7AA04B|nr:sugar phosphate isomerase/epimerase family protein [Amycolatopsis sp.]HVV13670.1 sugar phosphate isomerase/epimerase family protein [Amycolatopsis sp.]
MRLGSDALKLPESARYSPVEQLERAAKEGLEGLFFRTILHLSAELDPGELRAVREKADELGMYLEAGLGKVNPYNLAESPELRALGDGDTVAGFRRMMEAAADIGITELWGETATIKPYEGRFAYDRFRTDVPWADQLDATAKFLTLLAPIARDLGIHVNLETHEEITTFELVRIVETVGPDTVGITFDTANVLQRAEHPVRAAERIAPYVRQTHIKDAGLFRLPDGLAFQMRPVGDGVVGMAGILPVLLAANPDLHLSLEVRDYGGAPGLPRRGKDKRAAISLYEPEWIAAHPDLTVPELTEYFLLLQRYEERIAAGEIPGHEEYAQAPWTLDDAWEYVRRSRDHVRAVVDAA